MLEQQERWLTDAERTLVEALDLLVEHGWAVFDAKAWLGAPLLDALREQVASFDDLGVLQPAGIGRGSDHQQAADIRRDSITWLTGESRPEASLFAALSALQLQINRDLMLGLRRFEAQFACYQPGDFYKTHLDSFRGGLSRAVSLVVYLNPQWSAQDGGELAIYREDDTDTPLCQVAPVQGTAVMFLSETVPHEVLPAHRTRYSIAVWFRQDVLFVTPPL